MRTNVEAANLPLSANPRTAPRFSPDYRRNELAYGMWTTNSGAQFLFNRHYQVIAMRISTDAEWQIESTALWVEPIACTEYFYNDGHREREKQRLALAAMRRSGIVHSLPKLIA